ncbi:lycopene cyclase domain-containing protein [Corynebacterium sp.]|uniref:lycopene cyclase domain-containing protein n=1 Tax=Corynebacterium sp. TaxID=1720 RepID=UPI003B3B0A41
MSFAYLGFLLVALGCMVLSDWQWKLAFFRDARQAAAISMGMLVLFLAWDGVGIVTGTFYRGDSAYMTGAELAPEMPVEEPVFLFFLSYLAINLTSAARMVSGAYSDGGNR